MYTVVHPTKMHARYEGGGRGGKKKKKRLTEIFLISCGTLRTRAALRSHV